MRFARKINMVSKETKYENNLNIYQVMKACPKVAHPKWKVSQPVLESGDKII
jgi:hypothetical protein